MVNNKIEFQLLKKMEDREKAQDFRMERQKFRVITVLAQNLDNEISIDLLSKLSFVSKERILEYLYDLVLFNTDRTQFSEYHIEWIRKMCASFKMMATLNESDTAFRFDVFTLKTNAEKMKNLGRSMVFLLYLCHSAEFKKKYSNEFQWHLNQFLKFASPREITEFVKFYIDLFIKQFPLLTDSSNMATEIIETESYDEEYGSNKDYNFFNDKATEYFIQNSTVPFQKYDELEKENQLLSEKLNEAQMSAKMYSEQYLQAKTQNEKIMQEYALQSKLHFFTELNSIKNNSLLDTFINSESLYQELLNEGKSNPELENIFYFFEMFRAFLDSQSIHQIHNIDEEIELSFDMLKRYEYIGSEFSENERKTVKIRSPGWRYGDYILSKSVVTEIERNKTGSEKK